MFLYLNIGYTFFETCKSYLETLAFSMCKIRHNNMHFYSVCFVFYTPGTFFAFN